MTADWEVGETREVHWHPQGDPIPADAIDHGLAPGHHAAHSRLIETEIMSRKNAVTTEHGEPPLMSVRLPSMNVLPELLIRTGHGTDIYQISEVRVRLMMAKLADWLANHREPTP